MADPSSPSGGSINLTPLRALVVAALFGGLAGWLLVVIANAFDLTPPEVPWTAPIGLVLVAARVGALAYTTHQRIQVRRERIDPSRAVGLLTAAAAAVSAWVEELLRRDPQARPTLLEVGAGTGSASRLVLEALQRVLAAS